MRPVLLFNVTMTVAEISIVPRKMENSPGDTKHVTDTCFKNNCGFCVAVRLGRRVVSKFWSWFIFQLFRVLILDDVL